MESKYVSPSRMERLIRSLLLLGCSILFSLIAWLAGAYSLQNRTLIYGIIGGVVIGALLISRFGAKLIMKRLAKPGNSAIS